MKYKMALLICVFTNVFSFAAGVIWNRKQSDAEVRAACNSYLSKEKPIMVVKCLQNLPAGKILTTDDIVESHELVARTPSDAVASIFVGLGRELKYSKTKGDFLDLIDLGFTYRTKSHYRQP